MLVVTRRQGEKIIIRTERGEEIEITVARSSGRVRIGVRAPRNFSINREEIQKAIDAGRVLEIRKEG